MMKEDVVKLREFIEKLFMDSQKIPITYNNYDVLFVKEKFHTFYLFFFLEGEENIITLRNKAGELYQTIKENKSYEIHMDKNTTCIYFLKVDKEEYYNTESTGTICDLSKKICLVEEDLSYFKKNVLLYTDEMDEFAKDKVGMFKELCAEYINDVNFIEYKKEPKENYQYDFLMNLFIKIPFLTFKNYQIDSQREYLSVDQLIKTACEKSNINSDKVMNMMDELEQKLSDETQLFEWLDQLIVKDNENKEVREVIKDEN